MLLTSKCLIFPEKLTQSLGRLYFWIATFISVSWGYTSNYKSVLITETILLVLLVANYIFEIYFTYFPVWSIFHCLSMACKVIQIFSVSIEFLPNKFWKYHWTEYFGRKCFDGKTHIHIHIYTHPHTEYGFILYIEYLNHTFITYGVYTIFHPFQGNFWEEMILQWNVMLSRSQSIFSGSASKDSRFEWVVCNCDYSRTKINFLKMKRKEEGEEEKKREEDECESWCQVLEFAL